MAKKEESASRKAYKRLWRQENPLKVARTQLRHYQKKVAELERLEELKKLEEEEKARKKAETDKAFEELVNN